MKDGDSVIYMISNKKPAAPTPAPVAAPVSAPVAAEAPLSSTTSATEPAAEAASEPQVSTESSTSAGAATVPTESTASGASQGTSGGSDFAVGQEREAAIQYMLELGFSRTDIEAAMRAAFNNPHRAVEYLLSEIPASARAAAAPAAGESNDAPDASVAVADATSDAAAISRSAATASDASEGSHGNMFDAAAAINHEGGSGVESARLDNELAMLNEAITSNPELLQPLLQRLAATNPQIAQLIAQDPEGFVQRLMDNDFDIEEGDEGDDMEGAEGHEGTITLDLTDLDQNAINRLCELGFERNLVIQVYMACDKNEEVAADILFRDT